MSDRHREPDRALRPRLAPDVEHHVRQYALRSNRTDLNAHDTIVRAGLRALGITASAPSIFPTSSTLDMPIDTVEDVIRIIDKAEKMADRLAERCAKHATDTAKEWPELSGFMHRMGQASRDLVDAIRTSRDEYNRKAK